MQEEIKEKLDNHEKRIIALENLIGRDKSLTVPKKTISAKEFIIEVDAKDDVQRTAAFGLFLEKYMGFDRFNVKDIVDTFRKAREKPPSNASDKINKCIKNGWFMEHQEKKDDMKAFMITNRGEKAINSKFSS